MIDYCNYHNSSFYLFRLLYAVVGIEGICHIIPVFAAITAFDDRVTVDITDLGQDEKEAVFKIVNCLKNK